MNNFSLSDFSSGKFSNSKGIVHQKEGVMRVYGHGKYSGLTFTEQVFSPVLNNDYKSPHKTFKEMMGMMDDLEGQKSETVELIDSESAEEAVVAKIKNLNLSNPEFTEALDPEAASIANKMGFYFENFTHS